MSDWMPIETAPNDVAIIIARDNGEVEFVTAEDNDYSWAPYFGPSCDFISSPTHWMPIPDPPK